MGVIYEGGIHEAVNHASVLKLFRQIRQRKLRVRLDVMEVIVKGNTKICHTRQYQRRSFRGMV